MTGKTFFLLLLIGLTGLWREAGATIHTVSNTGISIAQHTTVASAHAAATAGDTIYVHGSPTSYGSVTLTKYVHIIGPGAWPEGNGGLQASFGAITFSSGSSGAVLHGLNISSISIGGTAGNNVAIESNRIGNINLNVTTVLLSGWVVRNNMFKDAASISLYNGIVQNWVIANNVFRGNIGAIGNIAGSMGNQLMNNVFYVQAGGVHPFYEIQNFAIIDNIVFGGQDHASGGPLLCEVFNNIYFGNYTSAGIIGGTSTGANNQFGPTSDPLFVSSTNFNATLFGYAPVAPYADLHLQAGSPAAGAAQGGGDLGIYGGFFPWPDNAVNAGQRTYYPGARVPEVWHTVYPGQAQPDSQFEMTITGKNAN